MCFALLLCCLQPLPLGIHTSTTLCTYYRTSRDVVYVGFTWSNRESCAPLQQKNYPSSFEEAKALTTYPQQSKNNIKTKIEEKLRNKTVVSRHFFVLVLTDSIYCLRDINAKCGCWQFMTTVRNDFFVHFLVVFFF